MLNEHTIHPQRIGEFYGKKIGIRYTIASLRLICLRVSYDNKLTVTI